MTQALEPIPDDRIHRFISCGPYSLEGGGTLNPLVVAYETWGALNAERDNAILVCHALTGGTHAASHGPGDPAGWWEGLVGEGKALDPSRYFVVCPNVLGSCYGSSGPATPDEATGRCPGVDFPSVTLRDSARALKLLLDSLGVRRLALVIGGSLGAMIVWRWLAEFPDHAKCGIPIAGTPRTSPWAIALNTVAREAIAADPEWRCGAYEGHGPRTGFALARMIAMISYRSERQFQKRFGREPAPGVTQQAPDPDSGFQVERYLRHQGEKVLHRFDARSYFYLTHAMDHHDIAEGLPSLDGALGKIRARVLAVGIDSDVLFPAAEVRAAASALSRLDLDARYAEIRSECGHDAFLVEYPQLNTLVSAFLERRPECAF